MRLAYYDFCFLVVGEAAAAETNSIYGGWKKMWKPKKQMNIQQKHI